MPFRAKLPLSKHAPHPGGKSAVDMRHVNVFPGITPVKAPWTIGAGGHAETAADTAVIVHGHDAILVLEGGPGGTRLDAGRVVTVITEDQHPVFPNKWLNLRVNKSAGGPG